LKHKEYKIISKGGFALSYFKSAFGQNLRLLRKAKNLTQEQLAELINLNQRQLTRIENGVSFVSSDVIERLLIALNIDVKTLFDFNLEKNILCQTGTDNTPYYKIIQNSKVTVLQQYVSRMEKNKVEEKIIEDTPDKYLLDVAKKLNKPISAQYFENGKPIKYYIYKPDGNIEFINLEEKNKNEKIETLFKKIKKISDNDAQLRYISLAVESLSNKDARNELKTLINGMELLE